MVDRKLQDWLIVCGAQSQANSNNPQKLLNTTKQHQITLKLFTLKDQLGQHRLKTNTNQTKLTKLTKVLLTCKQIKVTKIQTITHQTYNSNNLNNHTNQAQNSKNNKYLKAMPQSTIYKHADYMKQSGIELEAITRTMRLLTVLQEITVALERERLRVTVTGQSERTVNSSSERAVEEPGNYVVEFSEKFKQHQEIQAKTLSQKDIQIDDKLHHEQSTQQIALILSPKGQQQSLKASQAYEQIDYLIEQIHHEFVEYHSNIMTLTYLFIKLRFMDICGKFGANSRTWERLAQKKPYLNNTKNLFLKAYFLEDYLKSVKLYFNQIYESYPIADYYIANPTGQLQLLQVEISSLRTEIQLDYSQRNNISASRAVRQLRNLVEITSIKPIGSPFLLGFWFATVILIITAIVFIIVYFKINFTTNNDFERTFPIWRGLFYFIYLIWLIGANTYVFNYYKINFNLLTAFNNYHLPNPARLLICAAVFTSIHFLLFLAYLIKLAQIGNSPLTKVPEQFMPGISWLLFLSFFIIPLRYFYFRERLYPFMMFFRSIVSPIIGVEFKFSIFIQIFVSFRQPIRDMMYTFTYYFVDSSVVYWDTIMYETVAGVVLYFFRIIQNCRMMYQNRICGGMPIYSVAKSVLGFVTMITSYLSKNQTSHNYYFLYIWLLTALASTSLAYYMDIWNDWGLLDPKYGYLRQKLIYRNKKIYYGIIFLNLILRFVWMLNVSPDVLRRVPMKPYVVVMIISSIQITRRGIWMVFRVEKEHLSSQNALNKLFVIEEHTEKEMETVSAENQKQVIIKSPNWLKIKIRPEDQIKRANIKEFMDKNVQNITSLNKKLDQAQLIADKYSSEQEKFLTD